MVLSRSLVLGFLVSVTFLPPGLATVSAQMTPLARLECTAANFPSCGGWDPVPLNQYHTRRLIEGAGPQGQNVVEFSQIPVSQAAQYYFGFGGRVVADPAPGQPRYVRFRFRTVGPQNLRGHGVWSSKFIIAADSMREARVICGLADNNLVPENLNIWCAKGIDGYPNATQGRVSLGQDVWKSVQIEMRSSTSGASNGRLAIWSDNNTYASPTSQSGQISISPVGWGRVSFGFYANAALSSGGRVVFQIADVEIDDQFDSNWHRGGGTTTLPTAPSNLRVIVGAAQAIPIGGGLGALFFMRRRRVNH